MWYRSPVGLPTFTLTKREGDQINKKVRILTTTKVSSEGNKTEWQEFLEYHICFTYFFFSVL